MDACLHKSIAQYRQIIDHARQLESLLVEVDPGSLQTYTDRLQSLQAEASHNDLHVFELYSGDTAFWGRHPLFVERARLLERIVEMNNLLLPKIHGIMAVTANELAQIRSGRQAVSGYCRPLTAGRAVAREVC
ncbi:MAG: hypothetical protein R6W66_11635 [Pelovirga sp.]